MTFDEAATRVCAPGTMFEIGEADVRGASSKIFVHAPPDIRTLFALAAARTDEYLVFENERWTMPELFDLAGCIGDALVHRLGVTSGDRVGIAMRNYPEWIACFVAVTSVGAIVVPLNAWWVTDEIAYAVNDSACSVIVCDEDRLALIQAADDADIDARLVTVRCGERDGATRLEDLLVEGASMPAVSIDPDGDVTILYTSGTTGVPKGAVSTHRALVHALMSFAGRAEVAALQSPPVEMSPPAAPRTTFILRPGRSRDLRAPGRVRSGRVRPPRRATR